MKVARISCPACDQHIELPVAMRGAPLKCPNCDCGFIIPGKPPPPLRLTFNHCMLMLLAAGLGGSVYMAVDSGSSFDAVRAAVGIILLSGCGLMVYFIPTVIALRRNHPNAEAITVLNLVGGWTIIGWIVALVWAYTKKA